MTTTETKPMCPRCENLVTDWIGHGDEAKVCLPCRQRAQNSVTYIAVGSHAWGRGKDVTTAKANCIAEEGRRKGSKFEGYVCRIDGDDQPTVDGYGGICYFGTCERIEECK